MGHLPPKHISRRSSKGCKQYLSTAELEERTQQDRMNRHQKKLAKKHDVNKEG